MRNCSTQQSDRKRLSSSKRLNAFGLATRLSCTAVTILYTPLSSFSAFSGPVIVDLRYKTNRTILAYDFIKLIVSNLVMCSLYFPTIKLQNILSKYHVRPIPAFISSILSLFLKNHLFHPAYMSISVSCRYEAAGRPFHAPDRCAHRLGGPFHVARSARRPTSSWSPVTSTQLFGSKPIGSSRSQYTFRFSPPCIHSSSSGVLSNRLLHFLPPKMPTPPQ